MQIINFTAKEILQKLLNKEKSQTIRSAFKTVDNKLIPKPARFKINDKVKMLWKQRSPYNEFCKVCGNPIKKAEGQAIYCDTENCPEFGRATETFNKILGTGTIIDVFNIFLGKERVMFTAYPPHCGGDYPNDFIKDLAKRDGFNSTKDFFNWFDNHYNLDQPKPFRVIRWRWDL